MTSSKSKRIPGSGGAYRTGLGMLAVLLKQIMDKP